MGILYGYGFGREKIWFFGLFRVGMKTDYLSNEKNPGYLGFYRGWNTTQLYGDYNKPL